MEAMITFSPAQLSIAFGLQLSALVGFGIQFGRFQKRFEVLEDNVNRLRPVVDRLNSCVQELQVILKNKFSQLVITQQTLDQYGVSNSPLVLKPEYHDLLDQTSIPAQVEQYREVLVEWLKQKNCQTGLDAQQQLFELVTSGGIEQFIDPGGFKRKLYEAGKTTRDYYLILTVYLFETVLPQVFPEA